MVVNLKISYECGPCFLRQAREAMDLSTDDEDLKLEIMNDIFTFLSSSFKKGTNSNKTGSYMHNLIKQKTNCADPYINEKKLGNEIAIKYLPIAKDILKENDTLENRVKIAIVGNILDFGAFELSEDIEQLIKASLKKDLAVKDIASFEDSLKRHDKVLYLVDNTGEIVFDKLLLSEIKEYGLDITIAVKSEPILNDACMEDAIDAGLDEFGEIVEIGAGTVGYVDSEISDEFREIFDGHDFIISKGMGNYEGLTEIDLSSKDIYFLLCAKCNTISRVYQEKNNEKTSYHRSIDRFTRPARRLLGTDEGAYRGSRRARGQLSAERPHHNRRGNERQRMVPRNVRRDTAIQIDLCRAHARHQRGRQEGARTSAERPPRDILARQPLFRHDSHRRLEDKARRARRSGGGRCPRDGGKA